LNFDTRLSVDVENGSKLNSSSNPKLPGLLQQEFVNLLPPTTGHMFISIPIQQQPQAHNTISPLTIAGSSHFLADTCWVHASPATT
jgi:hypothetical protein